MSKSDKTLENTPENQAILNAIAELARKFDNLENKFNSFENRFNSFESRFNSFEKNVDAQFEAIRQGIVANNARFDRLAAEVYEARADIFKVRANVTELTEEIRRNKILV